WIFLRHITVDGDGFFMTLQGGQCPCVQKHQLDIVTQRIGVGSVLLLTLFNRSKRFLSTSLVKQGGDAVRDLGRSERDACIYAGFQRLQQLGETLPTFFLVLFVGEQFLVLFAKRHRYALSQHGLGAEQERRYGGTGGQGFPDGRYAHGR